MVNNLFDPMLGQLERVMDMRVMQHGLTASNLANSNTPNYKAQSVDFSETLQEVLERPGAPLGMARTQGKHLGGRRGVETHMEILEKEAPAWSSDGNSVNAEDEAAKMMENTLMYKMLGKMLKKELQHIEMALEGK